MPVPALAAAALAASLHLAAPGGAGAQPALAHAAPPRPASAPHGIVRSSLPVVAAAANDNRAAAGAVRDGALVVALTARSAAWRPDPEVDTAVTVRAFAEGDGEPRVPGPLLRAAQGTEIRVRVRNTFDAPLVVHGLRAGTVRDDTVQVAPGATREVRFAAGAPGTYLYRGTTAPPARARVLTDGDARRDAQLVGAIVVDPAGVAPDTAERVFVVTLVDILPDTLRPAPREDVWEIAVNGRSWPHTERLRYTVGDTVRWRWVNASDRSHPMHLHGFHFRTLAKGDGTADTTYAPDAVREVVTEFMPVGSTFRMAWVPTRAGNWLMHCHMLGHVTPFPARPDSLHAHDLHDVARHPLVAMAGLVLGVTTVDRGDAVAAAPRAPTRRLRVVARRAAADSGRAAAYAYAVHDASAATRGDGWAPSPPLVLVRGETTAITVVNALAEPTTVHWHGMELESVYDGVSGWSGAGSNLAPLLAPGDSFTVAFTPPRAGTFIYHSHMDEGAQLPGGLYGALVVLEPGEAFDPATDVPVVVGGVVANGRQTVGANGVAEHPPLELRVGTAYRFRLVNILPQPPVDVVLQRDSSALRWTPVSKDGAALPPALRTPVAARLVIGVGETYDVLWTPDAPGDAELLVHVPDGWPTIRVPIRVRR